MESVSFPLGISVRKVTQVTIACNKKNCCREIPALVLTSKETGAKKTSPFNMEQMSKASVYCIIILNILNLSIKRIHNCELVK